jgi:hypothetical protein
MAQRPAVLSPEAEKALAEFLAWLETPYLAPVLAQAAAEPGIVWASLHVGSYT